MLESIINDMLKYAGEAPKVRESKKLKEIKLKAQALNSNYWSQLVNKISLYWKMLQQTQDVRYEYLLEMKKLEFDISELSLRAYENYIKSQDESILRNLDKELNILKLQKQAITEVADKVLNGN